MLDQPITTKMLAEKEGAVGRIIFNNPARHNAVSLDMWQAVAQIMDDFESDERVRVIVVTGAGGKAFRLGRRHLRVQREARQRGSGRRLQQGLGGGPAQIARNAEADDRDDPGLLYRRGSRDRDRLRHPHRRRGLAFRHSGGQARARLRL